MKRTILILITILFTIPVLALDKIPGRYFVDWPDLTDDHQIHFIYLLGKGSVDKEPDVNGKTHKEVHQLVIGKTGLEKFAKLEKKFSFFGDMK